MCLSFLFPLLNIITVEKIILNQIIWGMMKFTCIIYLLINIVFLISLSGLATKDKT